MHLPTKFDLGQYVVTIWHGPTERLVSCTVCDGTSWINVKGHRYLCPECHGHGTQREHIPARWHVAHFGIVGRIQVETTAHLGDGPAQPYRVTDTPVGPLAINYMIDATGVGSGTLHYEPNVFADEAEAQAECDRRNQGDES